MKVFGLLHVNSNGSTAVNGAVSSFQQQVEVYLANALGLAKSLSIQGIEYELLTNSEESLKKILLSLNSSYELSIRQIDFNLDVPLGLRFYSAHFKLDVFKYIASLESGYYAFCDLDMVCINSIPEGFADCIERKVPLYYYISGLVTPAYGPEVIRRDLTKLHGQPSDGVWAGGEFLAGEPLFFGDLVGQIERLLAEYFKNVNSLHHVGDEAQTSAALEVMRRSGYELEEAGCKAIVARYWNAYVLHPQLPFSAHQRHFLLHLPSDKKFLARLSQHDPQHYSYYCCEYQVYINSICARASRIRQLLSRVLRSKVAALRSLITASA